MNGFSFYSGPLPYKRLSPHAVGPRKAYRHDGAYDLFADAPGIVGRSATVISTGLALAVPTGFVGQLWGRSKLASKSINPMGFIFLEEDGTLRLGGMIDAGYRGPILILLAAVGEAPPHEIKAGDAAAQLCVVPIPDLTPLDVGEGELPPAERGERGFGSSDPRGGLLPVETMGLDEATIRRALALRFDPRGLREAAVAPVNDRAWPEGHHDDSVRFHAGPPEEGSRWGFYAEAVREARIKAEELARATAPRIPPAEAPRREAGRIVQMYDENHAPLPPRQESTPRGSINAQASERMDRSIPDYPNSVPGAMPYGPGSKAGEEYRAWVANGSPAPAPATAPVRPGDASTAPRPSDPPRVMGGSPMGLLDALAQWQRSEAEAQAPSLVDPLPPAPAPRPTEAPPPSEEEARFWRWWGKNR